MIFTLFNNIRDRDKAETVEKLIEDSTPSQDFFMMIVLAISMASIGILLDNPSVVIGSMLISPMLYSFLSLSLGLSISDTKLIFRSLVSIFKSLALGVFAAFVIALFFAVNGPTNELLSRTVPSLAYGTVAFIAGFAAAFSITKPKLSETLPGIAIAVALIPPIAATGIGLAMFDWEIIRGSFLLFLLNMAAIITGSIIVFSLMNFYVKRKVAEKTLKKEETKIKKEIKEAEKL